MLMFKHVFKERRTDYQMVSTAVTLETKTKMCREETEFWDFTNFSESKAFIINKPEKRAS
jgi:hypothetical protein